jgi:hypothetical protein
MEGISTIVLTIAAFSIFVLVCYALYIYFVPGGAGSSSSGSSSGSGVLTQVAVPIMTTYSKKNGLKQTRFLNSKLPRSTDQPGGAEFSYACWLNMRSWSEDGQKTVFIKGNPGGQGPQCPSVTAGGNGNKLYIYVDTFSRENPVTTIKISNLPTKMFFHLAVTCTDSVARVYINGQIAKHVTLGGLPRQNSIDLRIGGFDGDIGTFTYYNYTLTADDVAEIARISPVRSDDETPVLPPYQDESWWTGD